MRSYRPRISNDGATISFSSKATNLINGFSGMGEQVYCYDTTSNQLSLISHSISGTGIGGSDESTNPNISGNGRYVTFPSKAGDLIPGFVDGNGSSEYDVYLYDRQLDEMTLVSHSVGSINISANGTAPSYIPSISTDGRLIVFVDGANDIISGMTPSNPIGWGNTFLFDNATKTVSLVNGKLGSPANLANSFCLSGVISADGSTIAFTTAASDIMSGLQDFNGADDVFVRDVTTGATALATRRFGTPSQSAGGDSSRIRQSGDGRFLVYTSVATNIVAGQIDSEATQDVFLYDRQLNTTILVSRADGTLTTTANGASAVPEVSRDGRYVAYCSLATDLVAGFVDNNGSAPIGGTTYSYVDLFLFDRITGTTELVSRQAGTTNYGGNGVSGTFVPYPDYLHTISGDGRYVSYYSLATDLVAGFVDHNGTTPSNNTGTDIFVFDRVTGLNTLVTHTPGAPLNGSNDSNYAPSISGDGRYIAYWGYSYTLVSGMAAVHNRNVFVFDQQTGVNTLVSHNFGSQTIGANGGSNGPTISYEGNYILYQSAANSIVLGSDPNNQNDIFLYNRQTKANTLVSHISSSNTTTGNATSVIDYTYRGISDDGRFVTYTTSATNIISGYSGGEPNFPSEVFVFDRTTGVNKLVSHVASSLTTGGNRYSANSAISGDGRFVTFTSAALNLVTGFTSPWGTSTSASDLYVYDQMTERVALSTFDVANATRGGDGVTRYPTINVDGSVVTYISQATNLVLNDSNIHEDTFAFVTLPPRVQSLQINDASPQRSIVRSITISFDEPVFFSGSAEAAFTLTRNGSVGSVQVAASVQNNPHGVVTLTFSGALTQFGSLIDGNYSLSINAAMVSNIAALDGNGDGVAGDNWVSPAGSIFRLFGDADGNRSVNAVDFVYLRLALGGSSFAFDLDGDGSVELLDFIGFRNNFGMSI